MKTDDEVVGLVKALGDPNLPLTARRRGLVYGVKQGDEDVQDAILEAIVAGRACAEYKAKVKDLETGPGRPALFLGLLKDHGAPMPHPRALVVMEDGHEAHPLVLDPELANSLEVGDSCVLDAKGSCVICRDGSRPWMGEAVVLERIIGQSAVVTGRNDQTFSLVMSAALQRHAELTPGTRLVANLQMGAAFTALPPADGLAHYRFLDRSAVPDVDVSRDIGCPSPAIEDIVSHIRQELFQPGRRRQYGLPSSSSSLLSGVAGGGKTLTIASIIRAGYALMSKLTGVPIDQLPPRVLRLNSQLLSKWLGESEKFIDRFFSEAVEIARTPFTAPKGTAPNGKKYMLPVFVVGEEIEALGRQRGSDHEAVHDRIMVSLLDRLDPSRPEFREYCIICLFTTNAQSLVDPAILRRVGSRIYKFGRLTQRRAFEAVLTKQLASIPLAGESDQRQDELRRVGFDGCLNPDHIPPLEGDGPTAHHGLAYSVGYLKALLAALAAM